jgi:hypothetical protein
MLHIFEYPVHYSNSPQHSLSVTTTRTFLLRSCDRASWHVTVHRDMWPHIVTNFLIIKPTRCTDFSNLFWKWNSTCCGQFLCPSSGVIHRTHSNGICHTDSFRAAAGSGWNCSSSILILLLESCLQTCTTYTIDECTVNNSWWWT